MKFQVKAKVEKLIGSGNGGLGPWFFYQVKETVGQDKTKSWAIFTKMAVEVGTVNTFTGTITVGPKKNKNPDDTIVWENKFNAEQIEPVAMDIPF